MVFGQQAVAEEELVRSEPECMVEEDTNMVLDNAAEMAEMMGVEVDKV